MRVRERRRTLPEWSGEALAAVWMAVALLAWAGVVAGESLPGPLQTVAGLCLGYGVLVWLGIVAAGIVGGAVRLLARLRSR